MKGVTKLMLKILVFLFCGKLVSANLNKYHIAHFEGVHYTNFNIFHTLVSFININLGRRKDRRGF